MSPSHEDEQFVRDQIEKEPRGAKKIVALLDEKRGKQVSERTIRWTLKKAKLRQGLCGNDE